MGSASKYFVRSASLALALLLVACGDSLAPGSANRATDCSRVEPAPTPVTAADGRPLTVPALRQWQPGSGDAYRLCTTPRILITPESETQLRPVAEVFAQDLSQQSGLTPQIIAGDAGNASAGDIVLALGETDERLGREGYRLRVGPSLAITAREPAGVFYGTRSILQLLRQSPEIHAGEALDWPRYPERGLMVDVDRKFFTRAWIERHLREMAWLKLNYFHLHFSENLGFRLESTRHPEIVSEQHYSQDDLQELIALAQRYHITVVPEIGMPGHLGAVLAPHPELQLKDAIGQPSLSQLDITQAGAETLARDLIEEFLPLFPGPYRHTGADEYMPLYDYPRYPQLQTYAQERYGFAANGKDAVHGFTNWVNDQVRGLGKTTRMWHDDLNGGLTVVVNPDIVVEWWTNFSPIGDLVLIPSPQELLDRGHRIMNAGWFPTYYTVGAAAGFPQGLPPRSDMRMAYENWEVHQFYGPLDTGPVQTPPATVAADEPRNLGAKLHVWCDGPDAETEEQIAEGIAPRLRVIAQKTWNSPRLTESYADFESVITQTGHSPGY